MQLFERGVIVKKIQFFAFAGMCTGLGASGPADSVALASPARSDANATLPSEVPMRNMLSRRFICGISKNLNRRIRIHSCLETRDICHQVPAHDDQHHLVANQIRTPDSRTELRRT